MIDLSLTEKFGLIGLKNQRSTQLTMAKKASLRCLAAATILEHLKMNNTEIDMSTYISDVLPLFSNTKDINTSLKEVLGLTNKQLKKIEDVMIAHLKEKHYIRDKNSLVSCDLEFETAGIIVKEYVVNESIYQSFIEPFRAELLEGFEVDDETIALLWLCKESGSLQEMFSENELMKVADRYDNLYRTNHFAADLYEIVIHRSSENIVKKLLGKKQKDISTAFGSGLNFIFPLIERSQAVFIESDSYFADNEKLLSAIKEKLNKFNIKYEIVKFEKVSLLKIDGIYYEAIPFAKSYKMPVHGVQLRKYPVSLHA